MKLLSLKKIHNILLSGVALLLFCGSVSGGNTNQPASADSKILPTKRHETTVIGLINHDDFKGAILEFRDWFPNSTDSMTSRQTVQEGQHFEDQMVKGGHVLIDIVKINFADGSIAAREDGKDVVYRYQAEAKSSESPNPASLRLKDQNFDVVLDLYAILSGRTLLIHPTVNSQKPVAVTADPKNNTEAIKALEKILADRGLVALPDGGKFVQIVPRAIATNSNANSATLAGLKSDVIQMSAFNFKNAPFNQFCDFYGMMAGKKIVREGVFPAASISLHASNSLTKPELLYAMDVLLGWQGVKIVNVDEKTAKALLVH